MDTVNWTVTTGCENLGDGCESCPSLWEYRDKGWDYSVKWHRDRLYAPLKIDKPTIFSVALGSDLFTHDVPDDFIKAVFEVMNMTPRHSYEVITKRAARLQLIGQQLDWTPNISMGVTVELEKNNDRIECLKTIPAKTRFVSFLPLLGPIGPVDLSGIHAAGVGPERWGYHRPCNDEWIKDIVTQIKNQGLRLIDYYHKYEPEEVESWSV